MTKIRITDLPEGKKITGAEMRLIQGGGWVSDAWNWWSNAVYIDFYGMEERSKRRENATAGVRA
jgi:hypothetical protein